MELNRILLTGMGLALLANMPPVCGIYTAFFPVLIYVLFATSKHTAMGKFIFFANNYISLHCEIIL